MAGKRFTVEAVFRGINKISKPVRSMARSVSNFVRQSNKDIAKLGARFAALGSIMAKGIKIGAVTAAGGIAALGAAAFSLVKQFSVIENAEASFTPLLKSATKATELVDKLNETAASTPFQFENLADTANQLLPVMKGDIENTIKTIRMLGDTSGGSADKLERVTRGYTKAMLKGKVDMESLNMIAEAGVPIFDDLAKTMNMKVGDKFFKAISAGKVKTDNLTKAFENMTAEGGIFFKGMEIASKTTTGVISTMKDNVSLAAAAFGKILAPFVKLYANEITEAAKKVKAWIQANEGLIKQNIESFIKGLVAAIKMIIEIGKQLIPVLKQVASFGLKAFEWISWAMPFLKPFIATLAVWKGLLIAVALASKAWAVAQAALNIVLTANPIGLIVIAIAALVAGIKLLYDNWETVVAAFRKGFDYIINGLRKIPGVSAVFKFLGIGGEGSGNANPVTPQERLSKSIERTENNSTLTIRDDTGRAELSKQKKGGPKIALATSGGL